jgi:RHS repeat-associated protein
MVSVWAILLYRTYDYQGRSIQTFAQNHLGGIDRMDYQYRFNGEVLKMRIIHKKTGVADIIEEYNYEYDHVGRKVKFKHSLNGIQKTVSSYLYDGIGRLKQKGFSPSSSIGSNQSGLWTQTGTWQGGSLPTLSDQVTINTGHTVTIPSGQTMQAGTLFDKGILQNFGVLQMGTLIGNVTGTLETVDYSYHIRGSLRGINLDAFGNLTNKLFSMKLGYEDDGNYFDGNIRKQEWKSSIDNLTRSYTYSYDGASRILSGVYSGGKVNENYGLENMSYDANGNIKSLWRKGLTQNNTFDYVDKLSYSYPNNSNKIQAVTDNSNEIASFTDVAGSTDYTYYPDGSLKSDSNKGITLIEYNYLKLPKKIVKGTTTILYQYDASGKKLKETIGSNVTDYVGNLIYRNNVLYQTGFGEGRIIDGEYEYNIKDHLGNLRVAFRDSLGVAKIVQANSYGIWGEELPTLSYLKPTWKEDKFKFTGKEELPETGYTDFRARLYDKFVPRFISVDEKSEKWNFVSPYSYVLNNPLSYVDIDGKDVLPSKVFLNSDFGKIFSELRQNSQTFQKTIAKYENNKNFNLRLDINDKKVIAAGAFALTEAPSGNNKAFKALDTKGYFLKENYVPSNSDYKFSDLGMAVIVAHEAIHQKIAPTGKQEDANHNVYNKERQALVSIISEYSEANNLNLTPESITALSFSGQQDSKEFKDYISDLVTANGTTYKEEKNKFDKIISNLVYQKK